MSEIYDPMLAAFAAEPTVESGGADPTPQMNDQPKKKKHRGSRGKGGNKETFVNPEPEEHHTPADSGIPEADESKAALTDVLPWAGRVYAYAKLAYEDGRALLSDAPPAARNLLFSNPKRTLLVAGLVIVGGVLVARALKGAHHED